MNFAQAVASVFSKYAVFSGRARRSEYWWYILFYAIIQVIASILDSTMHSSIPGLIISLALLLPTLAVTIRRLHDTDRRGWWVLVGIIPIVGTIWLIVMNCQDSDPSDNRFGPSPKGTGAIGYAGGYA